jgi:acyl-coenzyme A thioesterase PaaI-like protein
MSLTDTLGSLAVASRGQYMTGVSTDISTSFVKPAGKPGDELKITATLTAMGAFTFLVRALPLASVVVAVDSRCLFGQFLF